MAMLREHTMTAPKWLIWLCFLALQPLVPVSENNGALGSDRQEEEDEGRVECVCILWLRRVPRRSHRQGAPSPCPAGPLRGPAPGGLLANHPPDLGPAGNPGG